MGEMQINPDIESLKMWLWATIGILIILVAIVEIFFCSTFIYF